MTATNENIIKAKTLYKNIDEAITDWILIHFDKSNPIHRDRLRTGMRRVRESHDMFLRVMQLAAVANLETDMALATMQDLECDDVYEKLELSLTEILSTFTKQ